MLRTFTATLLASAAFARGNSTGLDDKNSITTNLITSDDVTLDIQTYSKNAAGQLDFHADFTLAVLTGQWSNIEFGFCLSRDEANWDCLRSRGNYDPSQDSSDVVLEDGYYTGTAADFKNTKFEVDDETAETDQNKWLITEAKTFSNCEKTSDAVNNSLTAFAKVTCTAVNQHFQRNYQTDQKKQDLQLTLEDADATVKGFGWVATHTTTDFNNLVSWASTDNAVVDVTTVSQGFKTQETATNNDNTDDNNGDNGSQNTEEESDDEIEDESDKETDDKDCDSDNEGCDSASQLTLSAAAALATLFTLNF